MELGVAFSADQSEARAALRSDTSSPQFGMEFEYERGRTQLTLQGELDALSVPAFAAVLTDLVERDVRSVTIDLSRLRFCNIGGLRAMAELAAQLHAVDGRVHVVAPAILTRMLSRGDLESLFDLDAGPERVAPTSTGYTSG